MELINTNTANAYAIKNAAVPRGKKVHHGRPPRIKSSYDLSWTVVKLIYKKK